MYFVTTSAPWRKFRIDSEFHSREPQMICSVIEKVRKHLECRKTKKWCFFIKYPRILVENDLNTMDLETFFAQNHWYWLDKSSIFPCRSLTLTCCNFAMPPSLKTNNVSTIIYCSSCVHFCGFYFQPIGAKIPNRPAKVRHFGFWRESRCGTP